MARLVIFLWLSCSGLAWANVPRNRPILLRGATPVPATSVTVNGQAAERYGDFTFAATSQSLSNGLNTFMIVAQKAGGSSVTNTLTVSLPASVMLLYDSNGNLTNDGTRSFAYSPENQLTNITVAGSWKSDFVYDGLGRRRIERDYTNSAGVWSLQSETHYLYDGYLLVQERDGNNKVLVTYTRGLDLSGSLAGAGGIGGLLARTDGNGSTFYHADGAGNVTGLMDGQQNMAARHMYDAFGGLINQQGPMANTDMMGFSSMPQAHGIVFYPGRPYDPRLRWLSRDPIGETGGINLYGFVGNNPIGYVDPYGLDWQIGPFVFGQLPSFMNPNGTLGYGTPPSEQAPSDPSTYGAMRGSLIGDPNDNNFNGKTADQVVGDMGKAIVENAALAALGALGPGEAEGAYQAVDEAFSAAKAAQSANCFKNFKALKRAFPNKPGMVWHHIVEQRNTGRFGAEAIHNMANVVEVSPDLNAALNAFYSSKNFLVTGSQDLTVRQWLNSQTFEQQTAFGLQAIQNVAKGIWQ